MHGKEFTAENSRVLAILHVYLVNVNKFEEVFLKCIIDGTIGGALPIACVNSRTDDFCSPCIQVDMPYSLSNLRAYFENLKPSFNIGPTNS